MAAALKRPAHRIVIGFFRTGPTPSLVRHLLSSPAHLPRVSEDPSPSARRAEAGHRFSIRQVAVLAPRPLLEHCVLPNTPRAATSVTASNVLYQLSRAIGTAPAHKSAKIFAGRGIRVSDDFRNRAFSDAARAKRVNPYQTNTNEFSALTALDTTPSRRRRWRRAPHTLAGIMTAPRRNASRFSGP